MPNDICGSRNGISPDDAATTCDTTTNTPTPSSNPNIPARAVSTRLSLITCLMMTHGEAPNARRTPISCVRSRTVTNMMLLTPTTPDNNVPSPTIQISRLMPTTNARNISKICLALNDCKACWSVGDMLLLAFIRFFTSSSN